MATPNVFTEYYRNQALENFGHSRSIERSWQSGHGFYKGKPWQKGYGIGSLYGSLACWFIWFIPFLKPLVQAARHRVFCAGKTFADDFIDGKSIIAAAASGVKELSHRHKKRKRNDQCTIPIKKRRREHNYFSQN